MTGGAGQENTGIHERKSVPRGTVIMKEGERGHCAYLIQAGKVKVYTGTGGRRVDLATLEAGQIFGEMALLFDEERSATVESLEPCNLIVIDRKMLKQKLDKSDPTIRAILPMLMKRIVQTNNVLLQKQSDMDELINTVSMIYQNIHTTLPAAQKKSLESTVLPKLDELMAAVKTFRERYAVEAGAGNNS